MNKIYWLFFFSLLSFISLELSAQRKAKYELKNEKSNNTSAPLKTTVKKEIYRIDFLLPLNLDELPDKQQMIKNIPAKSMTGIHFYEGVLLAIDSIEKTEQMYYDIYVHDISTTPIQELIADGTLDSTDVIIGALYAAELPNIAPFAKERGITMVSVLSPSDAEIRDNPYIVLAQPTLESHLQKMVHFIEYNKSYLNTVLLYGGSPSEEKSFKTIKDLLKRQHQTFKYKDNKITPESISYYLQKGKKNLIYTCAVDPSEAESLIQQLSPLAEEYPMEIVGYPSWKGLSLLTDGSLNENISIYLSYPFRFDEDVDSRLYLRKKYDVFKRGIPSELVYRGFETTLWVADALKKYGTVFNNELTELKAFSTTYNIGWKADSDHNYYFENSNVYIYHYSGGTLYIVE